MLVPEVAAALGVYVELGPAGQRVRRGARWGCSCRSPGAPGGVHLFFQAANTGTFAYPFLASGNAGLVIAHGTEEQVQGFARPVVDGRFLCTMALSEPQAGSSLGVVIDPRRAPG